jgi:hypothetical protein
MLLAAPKPPHTRAHMRWSQMDPVWLANPDRPHHYLLCRGLQRI